MAKLKTRILPESNYKAIYLGGKTVRIALDPEKPITELAYPEFYDVKVTTNCNGGCPYCYQSSLSTVPCHTGIVSRFINFFSKLSTDQRPFQIAFGGGEPTGHPEFYDLLKVCYNFNITPNYTTNGIWTERLSAPKLLSHTMKYCGGVAVSTHPHLEKCWRRAVSLYLAAGIHTNLHIIIGDTDSIDRFAEIYKEFTGKIKYFVLLPLAAQGRSTKEFSDWEYLKTKIDGSPKDVAFGANFHPYLVKDPGRFKVSIYDPEAMSAYLDLETMKVYKSSFSSEERRIG